MTDPITDKAIIRSAEMPVEPHFLGQCSAEYLLLRQYIDALKAYALSEKERADGLMDGYGDDEAEILELHDQINDLKQRGEKAESELAAIRARLMDLDAKDWLDTLADADKAMSAVALKEGK